MNTLNLWPEPEELLIQLCSIPSSSLNPQGVQSVQNELEKRLKSLDFKCHSIQKHPHYGPLLCGQKGDQNQPKIILVGHADTVREPGTDHKIERSADNSKLLGPGVSDDKGGLIVALYGLKAFLEKTPQPSFQIEFLSSPNEEVGSGGFLEVFAEKGKQARAIFGFEPAPSCGSIITSRHGNRWYEIKVTGKEAHSGRANGEEINAAHELCLKITQILELKKKYPKIKINIGSLESSHDKFNIVCGQALARLDLRFLGEQEIREIDTEIMSLLKKPLLYSNQNQPAATNVRIADHCPSMEKHLLSQDFIDFHLQSLSRYEEQERFESHGSGASDTCHLTHSQAITIDGLGPIGGRLHTTQEYVILQSLTSRARAFADLLDKAHKTFHSI